MSGLVRLVLFGAALWAIPFGAGMAIFAIMPPETALFDAIMVIVMSLGVTALGLRYFGEHETRSLRLGLGVGVAWAAISILLDIPFFFFGMPAMRMTLPEYAAEIGLTYFMYPIVLAGLGHAMRR